MRPTKVIIGNWSTVWRAQEPTCPTSVVSATPSTREVC